MLKTARAVFRESQDYHKRDSGGETLMGAESRS